jgi:hypothetical protein
MLRSIEKSDNGQNQPTEPTPDSSAGLAEITRLDAFVLACWRNGDVDMLRTLVNSLTGVGGLKLVWSDPLVENLDD